MIAQVIRNDGTLLLGRTHRLFASCAITSERTGSPSTAPMSHGKRFLRTSLNDETQFATNTRPPQWDFNFSTTRKDHKRPDNAASILSNYSPSKWSSYSMPSKEALKEQQEKATKQEAENKKKLQAARKEVEIGGGITTPSPAEPVKKRKKRTLRPRKALITLSSRAFSHLKALLDQPEPKLIRIGVKNRGCSGLTYDLQYITEPGKFDEIVEQDGVRIVIDSKALFSVVGSEMDWVDDKLSSRFIFKNPNSKGTCGCGESFMV